MSLTTIGLICQTIGSALLLGGYAPQIGKLHKTHNPTGISVLFWVMITLGCSTILGNMFIQTAPTEVKITQALNAIGALYTLLLVIYCRKLVGQQVKFNKLSILATVLITGFLVVEYYILPLKEFGYLLQTIGSGCLLTAYLPQIYHLYRVKDATGVSRWLFLVIGGGLIFVTINMIITNTSKEIIITEFLNIALIFVNFAQTVYYQNKKKLNDTTNLSLHKN